MLVESVHGTLRQLYLAPVVGDFTARRIAVLTGATLILLTALGTARWMNARSKSDQLLVGVLWVVLTLCFEVALGRLALRYEWSRILEDYDLSRGGLMGIGLAIMLLTPLTAARVRGVGNAAP